MLKTKDRIVWALACLATLPSAMAQEALYSIDGDSTRRALRPRRERCG